MKRMNRASLQSWVRVALAAFFGLSAPAWARAAGPRFVYDAANRLREVDEGDRQIEYQYDGRGNLLERVETRGATSVRTTIVVDEAPRHARVVGVIEGSGARSLLAYGPLGLAATDDGQQVVVDRKASVVGSVTAEGSLIGRTAYDAWGERRAGPSRPIGFVGEYQARDGSVWLRARHYEPSVGRFLQRDTVVGNPAEPQRLHRYRYANSGSPLRDVDPSGHVSLVPLTDTASVDATGLARNVGGTIDLSGGAPSSSTVLVMAEQMFTGIIMDRNRRVVANAPGADLVLGSDQLVNSSTLRRYVNANPVIDCMILLSCGSKDWARDVGLNERGVAVWGPQKGFEINPARTGMDPSADASWMPWSRNRERAWSPTRFDGFFTDADTGDGFAIQGRTLAEIIGRPDEFQRGMGRRGFRNRFRVTARSVIPGIGGLLEPIQFLLGMQRRVEQSKQSYGAAFEQQMVESITGVSVRDPSTLRAGECFETIDRKLYCVN